MCKQNKSIFVYKANQIRNENIKMIHFNKTKFSILLDLCI